MFSSDYSTAVHLVNAQYQYYWRGKIIPVRVMRSIYSDVTRTGTGSKYAAELRTSKAVQLPRQ